MERKEKEIKKQGLMVKKLKGGIRVGKRERGGPSTPPPTWRLEFSGDEEENNTANNTVPEFLSFPTQQTVYSARKLCASLWEALPHHSSLAKKMSRGLPAPRPRRQRHINNHQLTSARCLERNAAASAMQRYGLVERNDTALRPLSPANYSSSMEVEPFKPALTPTSPLNFKGKMGDQSYGLKTSTELLKVLNRIWSLEEQHASNTSLVKALKMELDHSRVIIKELLREKQMDRQEMDDLMKQATEANLVRKNKEQDRIKAVVQSIQRELEDERKMRKHSESLHRKLARELSSLKSSFSNALRELERERKARILLENLCDEFAKGIKEYEQEVRSIKHKPEKDQSGMENLDRLVLHISEAWLDERMQMKLTGGQDDTTEKSIIVDKLGFDIETFLQAIRLVESRKNGKLSSSDIKEHCSRRHSLESFPLNEAISAPQNAAGEDSTDSISHFLEANKKASGKQSKCSDAAEGHQDGIVKSNSMRKKVRPQDIIKSYSLSTLDGQFEEHLTRAMSCNCNKTQFANNEEGDMERLEKLKILDDLEKSDYSETVQQGMQEKHCKMVGNHGLKSTHLRDDLIRNHSFSLEDNKINPESNSRAESHNMQSVLTGNASPIQQWKSKLTTPDFKKSESSLRWPQDLKENTLMAKLLEARLEGRKHGRSKTSRGSF